MSVREASSILEGRTPKKIETEFSMVIATIPHEIAQIHKRI